MIRANFPSNVLFKLLLERLFFPTYQLFRQFPHFVHVFLREQGIAQIVSEVLVAKNGLLLRLRGLQIGVRFAAHCYF